MTAPDSCALCGHDLPPRAWRCPACRARVPRALPPLVWHLGVILLVLLAVAAVWRGFAGERAGALLRALTE